MFRSSHILGCYVTKVALHTALKLIARGKLTFDKRVVLHRVAGARVRIRILGFVRGNMLIFFFSALLLSSLELSDTQSSSQTSHGLSEPVE